MLPPMYGLPKMHKTKTPLRPILDKMQSPNYNIAKLLANTLN